MNEILIQVREGSLSIQGENIAADAEAAKKILQDALDAIDSLILEEKSKGLHANELLIFRDGKK